MTIDITMIIKALIDILIVVITIIFNIWLKEKIDAERYEKVMTTPKRGGMETP